MSESMKQLTKFYEAAYIDFPIAAAQRWLGGNGKNLESAGWTAYDAMVALGNEMTNQFYANPLVGAYFGSALETTFQFAYIFDALRPVISSRSPAPVVELRRTSTETRGTDYAKTVAEYRTAARTRRMRRAAA